METRVDEVAPEIYRFYTYVEEMDFSFNQYLVDAEQPLLFHTGPRQMFPLVSAAVATVIPLEKLRWVSFGHVEADECGSMNQWLAASPKAEVVHGPTGVMVSLNDLADRPPRQLVDGEVIDLGGKRVRWVDTSQVPHGWESGLMFEETTRTLLCGDLFTAGGAHVPTTDSDIVGPAAAAEDIFHSTALTPGTAPAIRRLGDLAPTTLALMHGPAYTGNVQTAINELADEYERRLQDALKVREPLSV
ncbi:MAG: MBL fold metallo-hydrolase [Actinomycetes bacterium]